jgi:peptidoglycan/xylan/chitin deacetylase (PgdA/CDA1 family)
MNRLSRRDFVAAAAGAIGVSALPLKTEAASTGKVTRYIAAYDTESPACLKACEKIVEVHKRMEMPATFFILARTLLANPKQYRALLDDPLFEIASHTYDHQMLRDHEFCGPAAPPEQIRKEIVQSKKAIEEVFEKPCTGLRPGCSFDNALQGANHLLALVKEAGYSYVSSLLWGPDYSMPALLRQPFNYSPDGFPEIWELPGHGWHENLLKNHNGWGPRRLALWPSPMPEAIPAGFVKTPKDEFAVNRVFLEKALEGGKTFVSLIWHPWSLHRFDPDMRMLELTFNQVRKLKLEPCTYAELHGVLDRT